MFTKKQLLTAYDANRTQNQGQSTKIKTAEVWFDENYPNYDDSQDETDIEDSLSDSTTSNKIKH